MHKQQQFQNLLFRIITGAVKTAFAVIFALALIHIFVLSAQAQTFKVIYNFTGGVDGGYPGGLTLDRAGNLYGTAAGRDPQGGCPPSYPCGTVFKLTPTGSGWFFTPLHIFQGGSDGIGVGGRVVFGPDGSLYGTAGGGGVGCPPYGCGIIFKLNPPASPPKNTRWPWTETVLYRFNGDVGQGAAGDLVFDHAGNIYGTAGTGGPGFGSVFELTPANGGWAISLLYTFNGPNGAVPEGGVIFDNQGNLYGTAQQGGALLQCGGSGCGTVYRLSPSGNGWSGTVLYTFQSFQDYVGAWPSAGLIFDQAGNLYGTTSTSFNAGGTVFMMSPANGGWPLTVLYDLPGLGQVWVPEGPVASLLMDAAGNLYGTTLYGGAYDYGSVFKLSPSGGGWTYTSLHDFTCCSDGVDPRSNVVVDANGNLYGTAQGGGAYGWGVVWEITP